MSICERIKNKPECGFFLRKKNYLLLNYYQYLRWNIRDLSFFKLILFVLLTILEKFND